jgi:hypothetical protein
MSAEQKSVFDPFLNKPDISESSRKLYTFNLLKLNDGKAIKDLKFLGNENILEKIKELKPNTRRTYLIAIVSSLKGRTEPKYKKLYTKFYEMLDSLNKELKDNTTKTEKVKENWIEQTEVDGKLDELKSILSEIKEKKKISDEEFDRLTRLVVLGLYTLQQPRRNKDYTDCLIVKSVPDDKEHNYLDISKWEWVFNNYKTQKTYKQKVIPVPEQLKELLQVYLKYHPQAKEIKKKAIAEPIPLLPAVKSSPEMTKLLNKIFGKKIGVSMLRAINLTDKYGDTLKNLKKDVAEMGTSVDTSINNYIKE